MTKPPIFVSSGPKSRAFCDSDLTYCDREPGGYIGQNVIMAGTDTTIIKISNGSPMRQ